MDIKIWLKNGQVRVFGNISKTKTFPDRIEIYFQTNEDSIQYDLEDIKQVSSFD